MVGAQPRVSAPDEVGDGLRRRDPERVDDDDLLRTGLDRSLVDRLEVRGIGARAVDAEEGDANALLGGEGDGVDDALEHRLPVDAERVELQVGDRRLDHAGADAELRERLDVGLDRAGEAPDLSVETGVPDQLDGAPVVRGHAREARLDPLDAEPVEPARELELVLRSEHDADGLLAVTQRRVVEGDTRLEPVRFVELPGPEFRHGRGVPPRSFASRRRAPAPRVTRGHARPGGRAAFGVMRRTRTDPSMPVTATRAASRSHQGKTPRRQAYGALARRRPPDVRRRLRAGRPRRLEEAAQQSQGARSERRTGPQRSARSARATAQ